MMLHLSRSCIGLVLVAASSLAGADENAIHVRDAWVREAPPNAKVLAAYFTIENHAGTADALTGASSEKFGRVELHRTEITGGVARMLETPELALPSHETVKLQPNGAHLMLMDPKAALRAGDRVTLRLTFKNAKPMSIDAEVRKSQGGSDASHQHEHQH